jgi:hypothetical protein
MRIQHFNLSDYPKLDYCTHEQDGVWYASHNARQISYTGATEHEAIVAMLNGLLELVAQGHMVASRPFAAIGKESILPLREGEGVVTPEMYYATRVD